MQNYPLVSCVTTTYNNFKYIYETLDSIFIQDYPNIEIVLSDDGSKDFPWEKIENYIDKHKRQNIVNHVILHEPVNRGTVWNCCNCRNHANGVYIMGIASDDRFYDHKVISDVVAYFQKTGAEIVACKRLFVQEGTEKILNTMPFPNQIKWMQRLDNNQLFQKLSSFCFLSGANTYYTKALYQKMGGYDLDYMYMEDYPFFLKLYRTENKIFFFDRLSIKYRYGAGASTSPHKSNVFRVRMYGDRIRYMRKDIIPYMDNFPYFRKEQMKVRLRRFEIENSNHGSSVIRTYARLLLFSPIGTVIQIWYQGMYQIRIRIRKNAMLDNKKCRGNDYEFKDIQ